MNFYRNVEFLRLGPSYLICFVLKVQLNYSGSDDVPGTLSIQYKNTRNLMKGNSDRLFMIIPYCGFVKFQAFSYFCSIPTKTRYFGKYATY